jgi:thioredoxin 1
VFDPVFSRVADLFPNVVFAKVDAERESDLVSELTISHIPCLMIYRDEFLLFKEAGNFSESQLKELITTAVNLDMDRLRASVAGGSSDRAEHG